MEIYNYASVYVAVCRSHTSTSYDEILHSYSTFYVELYDIQRRVCLMFYDVYIGFIQDRKSQLKLALREKLTFLKSVTTKYRFTSAPLLYTFTVSIFFNQIYPIVKLK